jgi:hypothetical protein
VQKPNQRATRLLIVLAIGMLDLVACREEPALPGIIYPAETARSWGIPAPGRDPGLRYWTPSDKEVRDLEAELPAFLLAHWPAKRLPYKPLHEYKRQYFGVQRGDSKSIYVNAFCRDFWSRIPEWPTRLVFVVDGDTCFFQVFYYPSTRKFEDLRVNDWASTPPNKALQLAGQRIREIW